MTSHSYYSQDEDDQQSQNLHRSQTMNRKVGNKHSRPDYAPKNHTSKIYSIKNPQPQKNSKVASRPNLRQAEPAPQGQYERARPNPKFDRPVYKNRVISPPPQTDTNEMMDSLYKGDDKEEWYREMQRIQKPNLMDRIELLEKKLLGLESIIMEKIKNLEKEVKNDRRLFFGTVVHPVQIRQDISNSKKNAWMIEPNSIVALSFPGHRIVEKGEEIHWLKISIIDPKTAKILEAWIPVYNETKNIEYVNDFRFSAYTPHPVSQTVSVQKSLITPSRGIAKQNSKIEKEIYATHSEFQPTQINEQQIEAMHGTQEQEEPIQQPYEQEGEMTIMEPFQNEESDEDEMRDAQETPFESDDENLDEKKKKDLAMLKNLNQSNK